MTTNHMQRAGVSPARQFRAQIRSKVSELYVQRLTGGTLATPQQNKEEGWDVRTPGGERLDVKSVEPHHVIVNAGDHRPRWSVIVVEVDDRGRCSIVGVIDPQWFEYGAPQDGWIPCWWTLRRLARPWWFTS